MKRWIAEDEWNDRYVTTYDVKILTPEGLQLLLDVRRLPAHRAHDEPGFDLHNYDVSSL